MKKILNSLPKSEGNILDKEELIKEHQDYHSFLFLSYIDEPYKVYRGVSKRGSTLLFTLPDQPSIDAMYQHSLEFFKKNLFINCINAHDMFKKIASEN